MKTSEALQIVGGLSKPSKMPGWSYGLPASECKTGKKLHDKLKAAYKVIETTKTQVTELQHAISYLTTSDGKLILGGISERFPNIPETLSKMNSKELEIFCKTFVAPYKAEVVKRETKLANENVVKNLDDNNHAKKNMGENNATMKNVDGNNGAVNINLSVTNGDANITNGSN